MVTPGARAALAFAVGAAVPGAAVACRGIAGIRNITYAADATSDAVAEVGDDEGGGGDACATDGPETLAATPDFLDKVSLAGGYLYYELPASPPSGPTTNGGVVRCSTSGCKALQSLVTNTMSGNSVTWADYTVGPQAIVYALEGAYVIGGAADGGDMLAPGLIGVVDFDGGNPHSIAAATYPSWVALQGSDLFWYSDPISGGDPNADAGAWLKCQGGVCPPSDSGTPGQPWVTDIYLVDEVFVDAQNLYFVAEPASNTATAALYVCSSSTPCGSVDGPKVRALVPSIDDSSPTFEFTTDGQYVYGTYAATGGDIVRIDQGGMSTPVVRKQTTPHSLVVDVAGGYLYFVGGGAGIYRAKLDGSEKDAPELLVGEQGGADNLVIDAQYVYYTAQANGQSFEVRKICK